MENEKTEKFMPTCLSPVTPSVFPCSRLRQSVRSSIATSICLLILPANPPPAYALRDVISIAPPAQRPLNASGAIAQKGDDVRALEPGKPIERELAGGESHFYQLTPDSGQYARVVVSQRGINVALFVFGPDGKKIVESDLTVTGESEEASLIAEASANYRLEVRSPDKNARKGRYEIKIEALRVATEQDKSRVAAERLTTEAMLISSQQTAESRRKALEKLQQSLSLWRDAKDPAREAYALYLMGYTYNSLRENQALILALGVSWLIAETGRLRTQVAQLQAEQQTRRRQEGILQQQAAGERARSEDLAAQLQRERERRERSEELARQLERDQSREKSTGLTFIASLFLPPGIPRGAADRPKLVAPRTAQIARLQIGLEPRQMILCCQTARLRGLAASLVDRRETGLVCREKQARAPPNQRSYRWQH